MTSSASAEQAGLPAGPPAGPPAGLATAASTVFGAGLANAVRYAAVLADEGVIQGLLGPREAQRIWDRHLLNCAVVGELLPVGARVLDVGSGAGLPGLALACARPDLRLDLVESMRRRVTFLGSTITTLELKDRVRVVEGRAESPAVVAECGGSGWVTARAVAPLDRLAGWCLPLLDRGGRLLALKGMRAESEVREHRAQVGRLGGIVEDVVQCGSGILAEPSTVIVIVKR